MLQAVVAGLPERGQPHASLAKAHTEMQRFDEAETHWALAEKYVPNRAALIHTRTESEIAVGRFGIAQRILRHAIEEDLDVPNSFFLLTKAKKMTPDDLPLIQRVELLLSTNELSAIEASSC